MLLPHRQTLVINEAFPVSCVHILRVLLPLHQCFLVVHYFALIVPLEEFVSLASLIQVLVRCHMYRGQRGPLMDVWTADGIRIIWLKRRMIDHICKNLVLRRRLPIRRHWRLDHWQVADTVRRFECHTFLSFWLVVHLGGGVPIGTWQRLRCVATHTYPLIVLLRTIVIVIVILKCSKRLAKRSIPAFWRIGQQRQNGSWWDARTFPDRVNESLFQVF